MIGMISNKSSPAAMLRKRQSSKTSATSSSSSCPTRCPSPNPSITSSGSSPASINSLDSIAGSFDPRSFVRHHNGTDMLAQRYDLDKKELAAGGYGKVFKANDKNCAGRVVAIKKCVCFDESAVQAVKKEASIMQEMDHPSICKIFEFYQQGTALFLVMEYCEGGEVLTRILDSEAGRLTEQTTAVIVKQIVCALKYSHGHGIAHRDLKPENVCFCSASEASTEIKVIDWGLSTQFLIKKMKSSVGTPSYSAPEVVEARGGSTYTSACDLWSLGVMTYVSLVGKPPFWGEKPQQLMKMKSEEYPMGGRDWRSISSDAKHFIRGLLKAEPEMRTPIDAVLQHPFLQSRHAWVIERSQVQKVLENMLQASSASRFFSICTASGARQLDSSSLHGVREVFCEFDKNCDGVLDLAELQDAFKQSYGAGSDVMAQLGRVFSKLDLDGSQDISYTEFCAAGIGEELCMQEEVLWSAFKAFDVCDDDDILSAGEIQHVLSNGDSHAMLPRGLCEQVARDVVETYDVNHDGGIDFIEFKRMMRSSTEGARQAYELIVRADTLATAELSPLYENCSLVMESNAEDHGQVDTEFPHGMATPNSAGTEREQKKRGFCARRFLGTVARATGRINMSLKLPRF